jgi:Heterokaryon incompatibility protein (HET)
MSRGSWDYSHCQLNNSSQEIRVFVIKKNNKDILEAELKVKRFDESILRDQIQDVDDEPYNALSWCWRTYDGDEHLNEQLESIYIIDNRNRYSFLVSKNLNAALKALRSRDVLRIWVDWICIDQYNVKERSNQVQLMSRIYGHADWVYVWLGDSDEDSTIAFKFIPQILKLTNFDKLTKDSDNHRRWQAVKKLMMRDWFSRRWIIQEIALARKSMLLCGKDELDWSKFADAVSLITEFESETRSLSQIMKTREEYHNVPDFFGELSALSAAHLVEITNRLFRERSDRHRERLLNLEYLVSTFTTFASSEARDTVYAILAIAKDTTPQTREQISTLVEDKTSKPFVKILRQFATVFFENHTFSKPYLVDYSRPISDIYVEFVKFCIERCKQSDPTRALDILCRPWAPDPDYHDDLDEHTHWRAIFAEKRGFDGEIERKEDKPVLQSERPLEEGTDTIPSWMPSKANFSHGWTKKESGSNEIKMNRQNPDSLVGTPTQHLYSASGSKGVTSNLRFEDGKVVDEESPEHNTHYNSIFVEGFILGTVEELSSASQGGQIPKDWAKLVRTVPRGSQGNSPDLWDHPAADDFWRTLLGDQSWTGRDPPRCYQRIIKSEYDGKRDLDLKELIYYNDCQPAVAVCRRVHAVIWNRQLMKVQCNSNKTKRPMRVLGLASDTAKKNDLVCILYGCSVPVILRQYEKSDSVIKSEEEEQKQKRHKKAQQKAYDIIVAAYYRFKLNTYQQRLNTPPESPSVQNQAPSTTPTKSRKEAPKTPSRRKTSARITKNTGKKPAQRPEPYGTQSSTTPKKRQAELESAESNDALNTTTGSKRPKTILNEQSESSRDARPSILSSSPDIQIEKSKNNSGPSTTQTTLIHNTSAPLSRRIDETPKREFKVFYKMIGECYVHGMMNGEAIDHQNVGDLPRTIFEIR